MTDFKKAITNGIPNEIPNKRELNPNISHAPKRKDLLTTEEKKLAVKNALRYFPKKMHQQLATEFVKELKE